jgi:intracellular sulfur oxidation DsrE/DsrF family protein
MLGHESLANEMVAVATEDRKEHHVEPTALPDFANVVPAGMVALAEAQRDGFAYIKP